MPISFRFNGLPKRIPEILGKPDAIQAFVLTATRRHGTRFALKCNLTVRPESFEKVIRCFAQGP